MNADDSRDGAGPRTDVDGSTATPDVSHPAPSPGTCPVCDDLVARARDADVRRLHAVDESIATHRALEDHENAAHPWQKPRTWHDPTGATYTYRIEGTTT